MLLVVVLVTLAGITRRVTREGTGGGTDFSDVELVVVVVTSLAVAGFTTTAGVTTAGLVTIAVLVLVVTAIGRLMMKNIIALTAKDTKPTAIRITDAVKAFLSTVLISSLPRVEMFNPMTVTYIRPVITAKIIKVIIRARALAANDDFARA